MAPVVHACSGDQPDVLAMINHPAVTLAVWNREPPLTIGSLGDLDTITFASDVGDVATRVAEAVSAGSPVTWGDALAADVAALAFRYRGIMDTDRVQVRLERITGDACRCFHADHVAVRLISTYVGRGTQWLDQESAAALKKGGEVTPHQLGTGAVGLFKGRLLAPETAIVHRSPPIAGKGEERLLLVTDPEPVPGSDPSR